MKYLQGQGLWIVQKLPEKKSPDNNVEYARSIVLKVKEGGRPT